jgi:hypothetical protein
MSSETPEPLTFHRVLEWIAIGIFGLYAVLLGQKILGITVTTGDWGSIALGALAGYLLADAISGLVHWFADSYASEDTPLLGPNFVQPFRHHHIDPEDIARHGFAETNGNNCIVSFWVLMWAFHGRDVTPGDPMDLFMLSLALFSMVGVFGTNQFHKWAHSKEVPAFVRWMQKWHLILPPDHHQIHHTWPHHTYFCITTGWLNWPLDKLRVFRIFEWVLRIFGRMPMHAPDRVEGQRRGYLTRQDLRNGRRAA